MSPMACDMATLPFCLGDILNFLEKSGRMVPSMEAIMP